MSQYYDQANSRGFMFPCKLCFRWKYSLLRAICVDCVIYAGLQAAQIMIYHYVLNSTQQRFVRIAVTHSSTIKAYVPAFSLTVMIFIFVFVRYWLLVFSIPSLDKLALAIRCIIVNGDGKQCAHIRRQFVRYILLAWIFQMKLVSKKIYNRFNMSRSDKVHLANNFAVFNNDRVVSQYFPHLITKCEASVLNNLHKTKRLHRQQFEPEPWMALLWAGHLLRKSLKKCYINSRTEFVFLVKELCAFQCSLERVSRVDRFNIPLIFLQAVVISLYFYFFVELISQQYVNDAKQEVNISTALMDIITTMVLFMVTMGIFRTSQFLLHPMSDSQEAIELSNTLNRHVEVAFRLGGTSMRLERRAQRTTDTTQEDHSSDIDTDCSVNEEYIVEDAKVEIKGNHFQTKTVFSDNSCCGDCPCGSSDSVRFSNRQPGVKSNAAKPLRNTQRFSEASGMEPHIFLEALLKKDILPEAINSQPSLRCPSEPWVPITATTANDKSNTYHDGPSSESPYSPMETVIDTYNDDSDIDFPRSPPRTADMFLPQRFNRNRRRLLLRQQNEAYQSASPWTERQATSASRTIPNGISAAAPGLKSGFQPPRGENSTGSLPPRHQQRRFGGGNVALPPLSPSVPPPQPTDVLPPTRHGGGRGKRQWNGDNSCGTLRQDATDYRPNSIYDNV